MWSLKVSKKRPRVEQKASECPKRSKKKQRKYPKKDQAQKVPPKSLRWPQNAPIGATQNTPKRVPVPKRPQKASGGPKRAQETASDGTETPPKYPPKKDPNGPKSPQKPQIAPQMLKTAPQKTQNATKWPQKKGWAAPPPPPKSQICPQSTKSSHPKMPQSTKRP